MGNAFSVHDPGQDASRNVGRAQAVTEIKRKRGAARPLPVGSSKPAPADLPFITVSGNFF
jgi:hypothetical protein